MKMRKRQKIVWNKFKELCNDVILVILHDYFIYVDHSEYEIFEYFGYFQLDYTRKIFKIFNNVKISPYDMKESDIKNYYIPKGLLYIDIYIWSYDVESIQIRNSILNVGDNFELYDYAIPILKSLQIKEVISSSIEIDSTIYYRYFDQLNKYKWNITYYDFENYGVDVTVRNLCENQTVTLNINKLNKTLIYF